MEERTGAEDSRGQSERAAAGIGQRERQRASGEGNGETVNTSTLEIKEEQMDVV